MMTITIHVMVAQTQSTVTDGKRSFAAHFAGG